MRLGTRGKLLLLATLLISAVGLAIGVYLERELRASLMTRIEDELTHYAQLTEALLPAGPAGVEVLDPIADRAGKTTGARVTLIAADGEVLGDSDLDLAQVRQVESHAERPEVRRALAHGRGEALRFSDTVGTGMFYVAVADPNRPAAVVRVAYALGEVDAAVARLRMAVFIASLSGLAVAIGLTLLLAKSVTRLLRSVVDSAQAAVAGETVRMPETAPKELAGLAGSLNQMARELERTMAMLASERDRFEAVLQTMDQAVVALDRQRRVATVNRAARNLLGLAPEVEGRTMVEVVRLPQLTDLAEQAKPGVSVSAEFDLNGTPVKRVQARATMQGDGGIVLVMHDVTEIRRLERVRRDFVANVSHELRTPISVIRANAELLLDGALDSPVQGRRFVDAISRHGERLGRLVADLLDISRIEAGRYQLEPARIRIATTTYHVFESLEVEARQKQIELGCSVAPELFVEADGKALEQILINLVGNAVKYTPAHGHVEVAAAALDGGRMRIEVRDDGPGIDPQHRRRVFERFYRVDPGRSRDMGGTGLGLSIVKHLVEAMDGEVGVDPRRPHGSVFWIVLPGGERSDDELDEDDEMDEMDEVDDATEPPSRDDGRPVGPPSQGPAAAE